MSVRSHNRFVLFAAIALSLGCTRGAAGPAPSSSAPSSPVPITVPSPVPPARTTVNRGSPPLCLERTVMVPAPGGLVLRADQLGYVPGDAVQGVLLGPGESLPPLRVCDLAAGRYLADTGPPRRVTDTRSLAGSRLVAHTLDLGTGLHPGRYQVETSAGAVLGSVTVGAGVHGPVLPAVVDFLRSQRCGRTTVAASGHGPCHLYASVVDGDPATASGDGISVPDRDPGVVTEAGTAVNVEGGWHDAGDYVKFVGTTAFVLVLDLAALRDHPQALGATADALRTELRWGLDWLARMLGGPVRFHQVSGEFDHDAPPRVPEADTARPIRDDDGRVYAQRPVFRFDVEHGRGGNLLGRGAAAFALAAQTLARTTVERDQWLALARELYAAAVLVPRVQNPDPPDFYPEDTVLDDLALGAAELARATGDGAFAHAALTYLQRAMDPAATLAPEPVVYWGDVTALALLEAIAVFPRGSVERSELVSHMATLVAPVQATATRPVGPAAAYGYALPAMGNGSVAQALGAAVACLAARRVGVGYGCDRVAWRQVHWLLGENPYGLSFMVGVGTRWPQAVHHALSEATGTPVHGAVVGGPVSVAEFRHLDPDVTSPALRTGPMARWATEEVFYEDVAADYVTNEPAIDFTAALVWTLAELTDADGSTHPPAP